MAHEGFRTVLYGFRYYGIRMLMLGLVVGAISSFFFPAYLYRLADLLAAGDKDELIGNAILMLAVIILFLSMMGRDGKIFALSLPFFLLGGAVYGFTWQFSEVAAWRRISRDATPANVERYLAKFPNGPNSEGARRLAGDLPERTRLIEEFQRRVSSLAAVESKPTQTHRPHGSGVLFYKDRVFATWEPLEEKLVESRLVQFLGQKPSPEIVQELGYFGFVASINRNDREMPGLYENGARPYMVEWHVRLIDLTTGLTTATTSLTGGPPPKTISSGMQAGYGDAPRKAFDDWLAGLPSK